MKYLILGDDGGAIDAKYTRARHCQYLMGTLDLIRLAKGINRSVALALQQPSFHRGALYDGRVCPCDLSMMAVMMWMERHGYRNAHCVRL